MWQHYLQPTSLDEALTILAEHGDSARIVAGGTDVVVELARGIRPTRTLIDVTRLPDLDAISIADGTIAFGALATHNDVVASPICVGYALPLAQACWEVGAPQLRARATVAGNLVTASPANDTITPLLALGGEVVLRSAVGERVVPLGAFYPGFRSTVLQPHELLTEIRVPALRPDQRGIYLKLGLRAAQAISVIDLAVVLTFAEGMVTDARIALGAVAPTVIRAHTAEDFLIGETLTPIVRRRAGALARDDAVPIDDVRGSATYRRATVANLVDLALERISSGTERAEFPTAPVLLDTGPSNGSRIRSRDPFDGTTIRTTVNGRATVLTNSAGRTLLSALRDEAGLTGTKSGCEEGECGACTVWLDGQAVMACLVPAPQAHGAEVTTVEGLAGRGRLNGDALHPLQRAFVERGAVQCGYCIPGMLMAGAKLLDERPNPDLDAVRIALCGNLCRCTGYRKIYDAVRAAAEGAA